MDTAPVIDGVADPAEYPGETLDTSTMWEGQEATPEDASATTRVSFTDDALYLVVDVTDDTLGTVLPLADCKRHWRTDSVEITVDPRGTSSNTSTTFKTGIFPTTEDAGPCFQRDADNHQGPGDETAPGMEVASVVADPYDGYTIEAKIPFDALPDTVDPERLGLNVLVYDSDTQDRTGQTRIGWSTFRGVQADPFRWALTSLPGLAAAEPAPVEPTMPETAALSIESAQSIAQSAVDGVALGGGAGLASNSARLRSAELGDGQVSVELAATVPGRANLFVWDGENVVGELRTELARGTTTLDVPVSAADGDLQVLAAFVTDAGSLSLATAVNDHVK